MKPRIIVCGLGRTGYKIFKLLKQQGADVVGISDRPVPGELGHNIIIGDLRSASTLVGAGIREAQALVLASNDDALNLAILTQARVLNAEIRIINRLFNQTLGDRLDRTLENHFSMGVSTLAAPIFAFAALGSKAIGQLRLFERTWSIHEEIIDRHHPWFGAKLSELWDDRDRMLIHYLPAIGEMDLVSAIEMGSQLQRGDRLIVGNKPKIRKQKNLRGQKLFKAIANLPKYRSYIRPITLVVLSLLLIISLATVTYIIYNPTIPLTDAFYFSTGMITGAGGQEYVAEKSSNSIKIFTAIMMLVGAGVVGLCYALINDFILGTRFKQFLDVVRIPTRNHYVVCGLGEIGIKIIRHLHAQGYDVVAIESDPNNRFLHSARSLGIPVILEDGSLLATLTATNLKKAAALITVTNSDTTNLEIALTAKAIAPKLSVIVRSQDSQFARSVEEVFGFDSVLSPTELAIHSFAAAALGGRILGNGMTDDLLWIALSTKIDVNHVFCGKSIKKIAMQTDFVPLYLETKQETIHGWRLLEMNLSPDDVLYLTIPANRLQKLWRNPPTDLNSELVMIP
jgi:Trk K+ transport system NAD-binding subunit